MQTPPRFRPIRQLGEGGSGVVYEAFDEERKTHVAIKRLDDISPESLVRFKREFRALQGLHHPNLVTIGELISEGEQWYFTMDLVDGVDLLSYVRPYDRGLTNANPSTASGAHPFAPTIPPPSADTPPAPVPAPTGRFARSRMTSTSDRPPAFSYDEIRLRSCLRQLIVALAALHAADLVHRDVKPSNIRVTTTGRLVLLDFGLVGDIASGKHETTGAKVVGTPAYMAPEQALSEPVGPAADLYSVGVMLYEALTGSLPFSGTPVYILVQKQQREPAAPSSVVKGIPADLDALCTSLLHTDPKMRPSTESVLRALDVRVDDVAAARVKREKQNVPFVGRSEELAMLRAAYDESQRGAPVTVLLEGESGVGKSCIVRHFAEQLSAEEPELVVLSGRCYERESVPYKAFDGVVDALAQVLTRMPKAEAALMLPMKPAPLVQVFPVLRRVEAIARMQRLGSLALDPAEVRRKAFAAMRELLTRLSDQRPLVIVIDDMQWADADSQALLAEVLRPPEAPALLVVATLRTGSGNAASSGGGLSDTSASLPAIRMGQQIDPAVEGARVIKIGRLSSEIARELATLLMARTRPDFAGDAGAIAADAEGHPLFIDALVRHNAATDVVRGPTLLEDALWAPVARLDTPARLMMELLAIAGAPIPQDVLAEAAELDPTQFASHVSALRAAHLVQTSGMRGRDGIEPYHDRVRITVRRRLDKARRVELHRRIAIAFETTAHNDAEMLATHWRGAGELDRARRYTITAAHDATHALAFDRAAKLYGQALELRTVGSETERRELYAKLGDALANAGRGALAAKAFQSAAKRAQGAESLELRRMAADQLLRSGHFDEGLAAIESVLASVGMKLPRAPWIALLYFLVIRFFISLRGLRFVERHSTEIAPRDLTRVDVCWSVAFGVGLVDNIRASAFQARHLALALRTGEPYRVARALAIEVGYCGRGGAKSRATTDRVMQVALAHAERTGNPHAMGLTLAMSGVAEYLSGGFRKGLERCDRAERILREECTGTAWEIDSVRTFGIACLAQLGELRGLKERHALYLREALDRGDLFGVVNLRIGHSSLRWLIDDDPRGAHGDIKTGMAEWSKQGFHIEHYYELLAITQADLYAGDGARAYARINERWPAYKRSFLQTVEMLGGMAFQLRARSALAVAARGKDQSALLTRATRDARRLTGLHVNWATPIADLLVAGATTIARGSDERTIALMRSAAAGFDRAEMKLYAAATRRCLGRTIGGDEGADLVRVADAWMTEQCVKSPARMTAMLAPGLAND